MHTAVEKVEAALASLAEMVRSRITVVVKSRDSRFACATIPAPS